MSKESTFKIVESVKKTHRNKKIVMFQTADLDLLVDEYDELLLLMDMFEIGISNERLEKLKERKQKVIDQFHLLITESKRTLRNTHILFKSNLTTSDQKK